MKKLLAVAAPLLVLSTPAFADTTAWTGVSAGFNLDGGGVTVTGYLGADTDLSDNAFIGFGVGAGDSGAEECLGLACAYAGRELLAEVRVGGQSKSGLKYYAIAGYSNIKFSGEYAGTQVLTYKTDGITGGAGIEIPIGSKTFTRVEFRYTDYGEDGHSTSVLPTIGFKF